MDLYDVLDQIVDLLRQRKRLTYRLLRRQFALDDETLEDLKDELIYAQKLAVEEDERVLVWNGDTAGTQEVPSPPSQTPQQSAIQETQSVPPPEPRSPAAERRHLTVMFCALVDSTTLSGRHCYLCGPPPLITGVRQVLVERGVKADHIHFERFDFR